MSILNKVEIHRVSAWVQLVMFIRCEMTFIFRCRVKIFTVMGQKHVCLIHHPCFLLSFSTFAEGIEKTFLGELLSGFTHFTICKRYLHAVSPKACNSILSEVKFHTVRHHIAQCGLTWKTWFHDLKSALFFFLVYFVARHVNNCRLLHRNL